MSLAFAGNYDMGVSEGATEDMEGVFFDAAGRVNASEAAYIHCLLDRLKQGEVGIYALSARGRTVGVICHKELDGDAEMIFGHVVAGGPEAFFLEAVAVKLFEGGAHTVRSNFNWPEPGGFVRAAQALGFVVIERMSMCRGPGPAAASCPAGVELLAWEDRHAGEVRRIMCEAQAPADRAVYPMFGRPEGVEALMESVLHDKHGRFLRELSYVAVAGRPIGFLISTQQPDGSILVLDIGVNEDYRRRGVGGALLDRLIGDSYEKNHGLIVLAVTSDNYDAIRLYERKGFRVNGYFRQHVLSRIR